MFAMQYRQDLTNVVSYAAFRTKIECLLLDVVVPRLALGRPNVVAFNEDIGLMTIATGSRGAAARALFADPRNAPTCESTGVPCGAVAALGTIAAAYATPLAAYRLRFPGTPAIASAFLAPTDTFARGWMQTFSDLAKRYGVYMIGSNDQAPFTASHDPADIALFADPDLPSPPSEVYVATSDAVYNEAFIFGPTDVRATGPPMLRNVVASNKKVPLTPIEQQFQLTEGPATGDAAVANLLPYRVPGTDARIGIATSLPAFAYGDGASRPAAGLECKDVRVSYMRCLDRLGANLIVQDEANPGRWAADSGCGGTCWQPLEWMTSTWRTVADPDVAFAYNVTPFMVGNLADLVFDGQTAITQRGLHDRGCRFVGNAFAAGVDPPALRADAGDKTEFLAMVPWVTPDSPRDELRRTAAALAPGSGDGRAGQYVETAVVADLPFPPDPLRGGCVRRADVVAPTVALSTVQRAARRGARVLVRLRGGDAEGGSDIVRFEVERRSAGARAWRTAARVPATAGAPSSGSTSAGARVRVTTSRRGSTRLRARSVDRAGNASPWVGRTVPAARSGR
jgi:hypothetical protein